MDTILLDYIGWQMQTKKPYFSCVLEKSLSYTLTYIRFSLENTDNKLLLQVL